MFCDSVRQNDFSLDKFLTSCILEERPCRDYGYVALEDGEKTVDGELNRGDLLFFHFRTHPNALEASAPLKRSECTTKGGATVVFCPKKRKFAVALCCPTDRFNRQIGCTVAQQRLRQEPPTIGSQRFARTEILGSSEPKTFVNVKRCASLLAFRAAWSMSHDDLAKTISVMALGAKPKGEPAKPV